MRAAAALLLGLAAAAGCASGLPWSPNALLGRADHHAERGDYAAAIAAYDHFLTRHPGDPDAPRARTSRDALVGVVAARAEAARLRAELDRVRADAARLQEETARLRDEAVRLRADAARQRDELGKRESDLARARQELSVRQAEADKLRGDLEKLKQIDMQLERRR